MQSLKTFDYDDHAVRVIEIDGQPWFVAADVCRILEIANPRDAVSRLDDDERQIINMKTVGIADGNRGNPNANIISESGLYALVFTSTKPEARVFRKWVASEVLPALRQFGHYDMPDMERPSAGIGLTQLSARERDQWLRMVRETRLIWGEAAARAVWAESPFPDVIGNPTNCAPASQGYEIRAFLTERCIVTGRAEDFLTARDLIDAMNRWRCEKGLTEFGDRTASLRLADLAGVYRDPETRMTYSRAKRDVTGYRGLRLRSLT